MPRPALAAAISDSQPGFAWESPSHAQVAAISDYFRSQAEWPWAKHRWELTLSSTTWEISGPEHPVDSYRPGWRITTLPLHP